LLSNDRYILWTQARIVSAATGMSWNRYLVESRLLRAVLRRDPERISAAGHDVTVRFPVMPRAWWYSQ
jgi:hypothetical protein